MINKSNVCSRCGCGITTIMVDDSMTYGPQPFAGCNVCGILTYGVDKELFELAQFTAHHYLTGAYAHTLNSDKFFRWKDACRDDTGEYEYELVLNDIVNTIIAVDGWRSHYATITKGDN